MFNVSYDNAKIFHSFINPIMCVVKTEEGGKGVRGKYAAGSEELPRLQKAETSAMSEKTVITLRTRGRLAPLISVVSREDISMPFRFFRYLLLRVFRFHVPGTLLLDFVSGTFDMSFYFPSSPFFSFSVIYQVYISAVLFRCSSTRKLS